jgi:small subunit ribosomal protein S8
MPSSKLKEALAVLLEKEGYIVGFTVVENPSGPGQYLNIDMKYSDERKRVISGLRRVSKPGLRVYRKHDELERVLGGLGIAVLSTSKGLMTDREARRQRIGGEVLCHVW